MATVGPTVICNLVVPAMADGDGALLSLATFAGDAGAKFLNKRGKGGSEVLTTTSTFSELCRLLP